MRGGETPERGSRPHGEDLTFPAVSVYSWPGEQGGQRSVEQMRDAALGAHLQRGRSTAASQASCGVSRLGRKMVHNPYQACSRRLNSEPGRKLDLLQRVPASAPWSRNMPLEAACARPGATAEIRVTIDLQNAINCLGQEAD